MPTHTQTAAAIAAAAAKPDPITILQDLNIGKDTRQNELVLFMKPELFMVSDPAYTRRAGEMIFEKLAAYQVDVDGLAVVSGQFLADQQIMDRHYGYINRLSKGASKLLDAEDRARIAAALELPNIDGIALYGGHEYLAAFPQETVEQLNDYWFSKKSLKIRSGFYIQIYEKNGAPFILVNGFHPSQLLHFTAPSHRIALFVVHSDTPWKTLRDAMIGATFPEKAAPGSVRAEFYANQPLYGLSNVTINTNGVHLSAGPFEGVFELLNFFGSLYPAGERPLPLLVRRLVARGLSPEEALKVSTNPQVTTPAKVTDLFSATEDLDTPAAVDFWLGQK